jgi:hypothetical protein
MGLGQIVYAVRRSEGRVLTLLLQLDDHLWRRCRLLVSSSYLPMKKYRNELTSKDELLQVGKRSCEREPVKMRSASASVYWLGGGTSSRTRKPDGVRDDPCIAMGRCRCDWYPVGAMML